MPRRRLPWAFSADHPCDSVAGRFVEVSKSPPAPHPEGLTLEAIADCVTNASGIAAIIEEFTGVRPSRQTAWRFVVTGKIPSRRISPHGDYLILKSDVEKFANDLLLSGRSTREITKARAAERRLIAGLGRRGATADGMPAGSKKSRDAVVKRTDPSTEDRRGNLDNTTFARGETPG